jgi:hypothetical protein
LYNFCPTMFLIQTIFCNFAYVPCLLRVVINRRPNVTNRKIPKYQLVCFVLIQIQTGFPSTHREISRESPIFPLIKLFQNKLRVTAGLRLWPPACIHAQHSCQTRTW